MDYTFTVNKEKIEGWLRFRNWNQKQLAESIKYDEGALSKIINGDLEPSKTVMKKIMQITGLGWALFNDPEYSNTKIEN